MSTSKEALYYLTDSESKTAIIYLLTGLLIPCSRKTWEGPLTVEMALISSVLLAWPLL